MDELKELLSVLAKPASYSQSRDTISLIDYCLSVRVTLLVHKEAVWMKSSLL